jgi:hypothetical protein
LIDFGIKIEIKDIGMIKLLELIYLAGVRMYQFKIHCATGTNPTPLEAFYEGTFRQWQEYQHHKNFEYDQILSLIHLGGSDWLFAGVYDVHGVQMKSSGQKSWYEYGTSELAGLEHLTGKVIITFDKKFRASYLKGDRFGDSLIVKEIKSERQSVGEFPGYNRICLPFHLLQIIIHQELQSWKTALSNISGVYLIADSKTGKQYIGSAYGDEGIWQRWLVYAETGHGGNKELRKLLNDEGKNYATNFLFTILEVVDLNASKEYIITRECHWKDALLTRKFGYNEN